MKKNIILIIAISTLALVGCDAAPALDTDSPFTATKKDTLYNNAFASDDDFADENSWQE